MRNYIDDIVQDIESEKLGSYWPDFEAVAYALYDKNDVYLFNHPEVEKESQKNYQVLKWDDQFVGCTLILYRDYPTAIVDLELYQDNASLYSIIIHELFHGFQYIKGETRFADETLGVTYPLSHDNIAYRNQERTYLYRAVLEKDRTKKKQFLNTFITLREKRATIINKHLSYENLIETIEGPAWYVELKTYIEKSQQSYHSVLKKYGQQLNDGFDSTSNIRKSCYSSGLFMCLLLDDFLPNWKEGFWEKEDTIYDILKQLFDGSMPINEIELSSQTDKVIDFAKEEKRNGIEYFEQQKGVHLFIEGKMLTKSFDPMNMVLLEEKLLHNTFIKVEINDQDYLIHQPALAYFQGQIQNISVLHLILQESPIENIDSLTIEGIGLIKGNYTKGENAIHLYVN